MSDDGLVSRPLDSEDRELQAGPLELFELVSRHLMACVPLDRSSCCTPPRTLQAKPSLRLGFFFFFTRVFGAGSMSPTAACTDRQYLCAGEVISLCVWTMDACLVGYSKDIIPDTEGPRSSVAPTCATLHLLESNPGALFGLWVKCRFVYYSPHKAAAELPACYVSTDRGFIFVGLKVGVVVGTWEGK